MKNVILTLINNVDNVFEDNIERYKFDKNKSNDEELKKIVIDINKSQNESVSLITNKENLFEFFNRDIICEYIDLENGGKNSIPEKKIQLNLNPYFDGIFKNIRNIFFNNINELLIKYGSVFQIDIEKLIAGTTYKLKNKNNLFELVNEDLNLILFKGIVTSRLCIVFYRLTYFDLNASKAYIGRFFSQYFDKSESFKMNLNRNSFGWFFTDLNDKIFRGYKIKPLVFAAPNNLLDLKVTIAKKLLSNNVKLKIVADAVGIDEKKLKDFVYNQPIKVYKAQI